MDDARLLRQLATSRSLSPPERRAVLRAADVLEQIDRTERQEEDTRPIEIPASVRMAAQGHR